MKPRLINKGLGSERLSSNCTRDIFFLHEYPPVWKLLLKLGLLLGWTLSIIPFSKKDTTIQKLDLFHSQLKGGRLLVSGV